jgi:predicted permease
MHAIEQLASDIRFAIRQLRRHASFTTAAILMLALGVCASVAIFAFVDAALIKPLPYRDSARLVGVYETVPMFPRSNLSYFDYLDWKRLNTSFSALDVYNRTGFIMRTASGAEPVRATRVSDGFFRTLGVTPVLGRDFRPGDDLPSAARTTLVTYATWQSRYGGRADILGTTVTLDDEPVTIIGVLPRTFHFVPGEPAEFWPSLSPTRGCDKRRSCHNLYGVARLKDGVSIEAAFANVTAIATQLQKEYPDSNRDQGASLAPLNEVIVGDVRPILLLLLAGAGLLLTIASVNAASLLLVRSESRAREVAVRRTLGASWGRLVGQFATEAIVLVATGSLIGVVAAHWLMRLLISLVPAYMMAGMAYLRDVGLNVRVGLFAGAIALAATLLFTLIPSLRLAATRDSQEALAEGSRGSAGRLWRKLGARLIVVELAIAVVLLASAGLLSQSLYRLLRVDVGFQPDRVAMLQVGAPDASYGSAEKLEALQREIIGRVERLPGVESAGIASQIVLSGNGNTTWLRVIGRPWPGERLETPFREITPGYLRTIGATLIRGRHFAESDDRSKPNVAIINRTFARQHFKNEDPIGQHLTYLSDPPEPIEIVGIVGDLKEGPLDVATPPVMYIPYNQSASSNFGLAVRTAGSRPETILPALPALLREINRGIVSMDPMTLRDRVQNSPSAYLHRSSAWLVSGFAALALVLGVVGLYGVIAYSVSQRRREVGVRMALGAQRSAVYRLVLMEAGRLTLFGIVAGLIGALGAGTMMQSLLFNVRWWDVPTLAAVAIVLGVAALCASFIPARRAASVNPVEALRAE